MFQLFCQTLSFQQQHKNSAALFTNDFMTWLKFSKKQNEESTSNLQNDDVNNSVFLGGKMTRGSDLCHTWEIQKDANGVLDSMVLYLQVSVYPDVMYQKCFQREGCIV